MKPSAIYLEAAKLVDRGEALYSCWAIDDIERFYCSGPKSLVDDYSRNTGFKDLEMTDVFNNEKRQIRVLLLCLMSAKAKSEGR